MDPEDEVELTVLWRTLEAARKAEEDAQNAAFAFMQRKLKEAKRGTVEQIVREMMGITKLSRARIFDIGAGKWSRTPGRNPAVES